MGKLELKNGDVFKDINNNEYYIIEFNKSLGVVKFYKNFTKNMEKVRVYERFIPISMRISEFKKLIESK